MEILSDNSICSLPVNIRVQVLTEVRCRAEQEAERARVRILPVLFETVEADCSPTYASSHKLYSHYTYKRQTRWVLSDLAAVFAWWYVQMSVFIRAFLSLLSPLCIRKCALFGSICSWCACSFSVSVIFDSPWFSCDIISYLIPLPTYVPPQ